MLPKFRRVKNMKNRIITKDEINKITNECKPREKAFLTIMRQSGLEPHTIKKLKIKNLEKILEPNPPTPCKIEIGKFGKPPAFLGEEAIKYLKDYLGNRENLTPESLLFTNNKNPNKEINTKDVSRAFRITAQKLNKTGKITFEVRIGKPSELHLYSLIEFYKENAKGYLTELKSSISKDDEFCRKLYEERAMPFLETETLTPEIYKLRKQQQREMEKQNNENRELKDQLEKMEQNLKITKQWFGGYIDATKEIKQEMQQEIEKRDHTIQNLEERLTKLELDKKKMPPITRAYYFGIDEIANEKKSLKNSLKEEEEMLKYLEQSKIEHKEAYIKDTKYRIKLLKNLLKETNQKPNHDVP
jgi:hypothetical protein